MIYPIKIYLAGTIYKEEPDSTWKTNFIDILSNNRTDNNYIFLDPEPEFEGVNHAMVARDKEMIQECDIFVAYIQRASFGTSMEIFYAYQLQTKPVLVINPNLKFFEDLWLTYHSHYRYIKLELCAEYIKEMK